jgi:hypothetical protein
MDFEADVEFDADFAFQDKFGLAAGMEFNADIDFDEETDSRFMDAVEWRGCRSEARPRSSTLMDIGALGPPQSPFLRA